MATTNLSDVLDFHMTEIVAFALEKFAGIFHGSAARKAKRDMLLSDAEIAKRAIPFKNGDTPGIHGFARGRHRFFHQGAESVHHMDKSGIFAGQIKIDGSAGAGCFRHRTLREKEYYIIDAIRG